MKLSSVFSAQNVYSNLKKENVQKSNFNNGLKCDTVSFSKSKYSLQDIDAHPVHQRDFIKNGGRIHFLTATTGIKPYNGQLIRTYNDEQVGSYYAGGQKYLIEFQNFKPELEDSLGTILTLETAKINPDSCREVTWVNTNKNCRYIERFRSNGTLKETVLIQLGDKNINNSERDELCSQFVTFEDDGTTAKEVNTKLGSKYEAILGYTNKITKYSQGIKREEIVRNCRLPDKKIAEKKTKFDTIGSPIIIEETNVEYYNGKEHVYPIATSKKCITEFVSGMPQSRDYGIKVNRFKEDTPGFIRKAFSENNNIIRDIDLDGNVVYLDGNRDESVIIKGDRTNFWGD